MSGYGQFCAAARAHEVLGGRWTLLVVREILSGSHRFNDIRRGIPRVSRTVLAERLHTLISVGVLDQLEGAHGPEYVLTDAGAELAPLVGAFAAWGQRWLPRRADDEDLDLDPLLLDMQRRVRMSALPKAAVVARFDIRAHGPRFLLLRATEVSVCSQNPGFPESLRVSGPIGALVTWWRGDGALATARRMGLSIDGPPALVRAFPDWFDRYQFAHIAAQTQNEKLAAAIRPSRERDSH